MTQRDWQEITSKENKQVKNCTKLISSKKYRAEEKMFVAEGLRLCEDAIHSGLVPIQTFVTKEMLERSEKVLQQSQQVFVVSQEISAKMSDTQTPQGLFCIFSALDNAVSVDTIKWQRVILLSSLQDPGNLGTIIRTSEAFGIDGLILSDDCPDLCSPKVLRSTMGGVFRLPIKVVHSMEEEIHALRQNGFSVYAAALTRDSVPVTEIDLPQKAAMVIGNEGNGLTDSVMDACTGRVIIPMKGKAESLNAAIAASVLIWEMSRR